MSRICLIGDVLVDVTLQTKETPLKMRLGGIVHSARALWVMGIEYDICYFAPKYLKKEIEEFMNTLGSPRLFYLGEVQRCPYVMLINEVKEIGNQGYEFLLRDKIEIDYYEENLRELNKYSDVIIISGNFNLIKILKELDLDAKVSIDFANNINDFIALKEAGLKFEKIFISTSSNYFLEYYNNIEFFFIEDFFKLFSDFTNKIILKENRGGSRAFDFANNELIAVSSQTQPIVHSVGVGDVYNVVCVCKNMQVSFEESLNYASWIASRYALTTFPMDFKLMSDRILKSSGEELVKLKGVFLPWENRKAINIYIAAPDFDYIDTSLIDLLCENLLYHNFSPRRPIKENGQMNVDDDKNAKQFLFNKDMQLLEECQILIAVLLFNDPGTLIEIGVAAERKLPTFVYDPKRIAQNCMLTQIPNLVSSDLDEIISEVFSYASKI
ncbi:nucleoside 2-deoxyribosyltransferase [Flavobacterium anhuiense]|uniref:nucleoside 2-deoxyribosyltransferase n=1 Tax=Flavobacterium anhuiense TaxID=459526 RepID=UPI000E6C4B11|nr:nucleoside 2-deoxyribosyltransferase [Flavobacterium anhuiense]